MKIKEEFKNIFSGANKKINLAILWTTLILFIYCYFGTFTFFENTFANVENLAYWKIIYHNCMAFVMFFLFGMFYTKFIMKQNLSNVGVKKGNVKLSLIIIAIATLIVPLVALSTTLDSSMVATYPLINFATFGQWYYIIPYFLSYILYYIGWEYLFRGVLFFTIKEKTSVLFAILITTMISALIHTSIGGFGKPMIETLSAIPAGLIFGWIAYKTENIWTSLYVHALVGILTDVMIWLIMF